MRIYIPAMACDFHSEHLQARTVHALTPALRRAVDTAELQAGEVQEYLEAVAMNAAADDSLRLLITHAAAGTKPTPRRLVIAADCAESMLAPCTDDEQVPSALVLTEPCAWEDVCAFHMDDEAAQSAVEAALTGDDAAFEATYEYELAWYDVSERSALAAEYGTSEESPCESH